MKKYAVLFLLVAVSLAYDVSCEGADLSGPQAPAPYGVFSTLSPSSPEKGQAAVAISVEKSGAPDFYRFSTELASGITDTVEFGMNIPYQDDGTTGVEDIALSVKHRVLEGTGYSPSAAYLVTASLGSGRAELSTKGRLGAGVAVGKKVGPFRAILNLLYSVPRDTDRHEEVRFSTGLEFSAASHLTVLAELYGKDSHFSDKLDELEARFGYRIRYGKHMYSTLGAGFGVGNLRPDYRLLVSLSLGFPRVDPVEGMSEEVD